MTTVSVIPASKCMAYDLVNVLLHNSISKDNEMRFAITWQTQQYLSFTVIPESNICSVVIIRSRRRGTMITQTPWATTLIHHTDDIILSEQGTANTLDTCIGPEALGSTVKMIP